MEIHEKECTDYLLDMFIFDKFKIVLEDLFKATIELEAGTKKGTAKIVGLEPNQEDRRATHTFSWDFINHSYNKDDVTYNRCECFEYDRKSYEKDLIADDFQIEAETEIILAYCYHIMNTKRERTVKPKSVTAQKENKPKKELNHYDKKIYLFDELIEYVNENGLNQTKHTGNVKQCPCWSVRGHWRHYKSGKVIFVKDYKKGKDRANTEPKDKTYTM